MPEERIRKIRDLAVSLGDVDGGRALADALDSLSSIGLANFADRLSMAWCQELYDMLTVKISQGE